MNAVVAEPGLIWEERDGTAVVGGGVESGLYVGDRAIVDLLASVDGRRTPREVAIAALGGAEPPDGERIAALEAGLEELIRRGIVSVGTSPPGPRKVSVEERFSHLFLELTSRCNLRCKHCYMEGGLAKPHEITLPVFLRLIDEFAALGGQYVTLSGGEPLMFRDWDIVAQHGARHGLKLSVMTNGRYLDRERLNVIASLGATVGLGFDGARKETHDAVRGKGAFAEALRALEGLVAFGYAKETTLCFTAMRPNVDDIPAMIDLALDSGVSRLYISLMEQRGRAAFFKDKLSLDDEQKRDLIAYLFDASAALASRLTIEVTHHTDVFRRLTVNEPRTGGTSEHMTVRVTSDGEVYLSAYMGAQEHCVGHADRDSLGSMLRSELAVAIIDAIDARVDRISQCRSCLFRHVCRGGSAVLAHSRFGSFDEPDEYCGARLHLFDKVVRSRTAALIAAGELSRGG